MRLRQLMSERGLSVNDLAEMTDVPYETIRNIYYEKTKDPKVSTMIEISDALGVSVNFLCKDGYKPSEERKVLFDYRACGLHGKHIIETIAHLEAEFAKAARYSDRYSIMCMTPIGDVNDGIVYNTCELTKIETNIRQADIAIEVTTNYFAPAYCKGDCILLQMRFPRNKERAVFSDGVKMYFREFVEHEKNYELKCLNGNGESFFLDRMDKVECVGTCIGVVR